MSVAPDRVLVVIARTRHKMIQAELKFAGDQGATFIELRLDYLTKAVEFKRLAPYKLPGQQWVCTLRRPQDGGRWAGSEDERLTVIRQAIVSGVFDWVDLEYDVADKVRRFGPVKRIVSYHNLEETPANLAEVYETMLTRDADVYKVVTTAHHPNDCARVLELQKTAPKPTVAFCMSDLGFPTRFVALKYGAPWTYAGFNRDRTVASGMPSYQDVRTVYHARQVGPNTKFYGLLGDPVAHSLSPVLHNALFRKFEIDALYVPFRVPKGQVPAAAAKYGAIPVSGYSVTIPHKEAAAQMADQDADETVARTGAANTLVRQEDGEFRAYNTDADAALESLRAAIAERPEGERTQFNQLFVLVLGAGGAARAVAHALSKAGAHLTITSRTADRAEALASEVRCKTLDWHARHSAMHCNVVVNCTPVGMHPNTGESPLAAGFLRPGLTVFDTIYTPENTLLVNDARARGCQVVTGVDMFVRQAARQFELFTGIAPPVEPMRELLRRAMSAVTALSDSSALSSLDEPKPAEPTGEDTSS
jgi:3-dehydroquinate dehydratase/shikimate dehydrogenase